MYPHGLGVVKFTWPVLSGRDEAHRLQVSSASEGVDGAWFVVKNIYIEMEDEDEVDVLGDFCLNLE